MKKLYLNLFLLLPLVYLVYLLFFEEVSDPIKFIYTYTSVVAIVILFFTTIISLFKTWFNLLKYRKIIGLYGFFYAFLHLSNFVILDSELDIVFLLEETADKPFVYLGMIAFSLLLFMAITSTKALYKRFNKYHAVLYPALVLITIHFVMAQKSLSVAQWGYLALIFLIAFSKIIVKTISKMKINDN